METVEVPPPRRARVAIANPRRVGKFTSIEDRLAQVEAAIAPSAARRHIANDIALFYLPQYRRAPNWYKFN